jgi:hypothetical protein
MPCDSPTQPELRSAFHNFVHRSAQEHCRALERLAGRDFEPQIIVILARPRIAVIDVLHAALDGAQNIYRK